MDLVFIFIAKYLFVLPIVALGVYFLAQSNHSKIHMAFFGVPAGLAALGLGLLANLLILDPRPFVIEHFTPLVAHAPDNGFPSDHVLLLAAIAAIATAWNRTLGLSLWSIAIVVAIARVYVGLHHISDVLGSMIISSIAVVLVYALFKYVWHKEII